MSLAKWNLENKGEPGGKGLQRNLLSLIINNRRCRVWRNAAVQAPGHGVAKRGKIAGDFYFYLQPFKKKGWLVQRNRYSVIVAQFYGRAFAVLARHRYRGNGPDPKRFSLKDTQGTDEDNYQ